MIDALSRNLWIISNEAKNNNTRRYIAKAFAGVVWPAWDLGWGVFDQKQGRFLKNKETEALSELEVREAITN